MARIPMIDFFDTYRLLVALKENPGCSQAFLRELLGNFSEDRLARYLRVLERRRLATRQAAIPGPAEGRTPERWYFAGADSFRKLAPVEED